jgi:hypothetical protein
MWIRLKQPQSFRSHIGGPLPGLRCWTSDQSKNRALSVCFETRTYAERPVHNVFWVNPAAAISSGKAQFHRGRTAPCRWRETIALSEGSAVRSSVHDLCAGRIWSRRAAPTTASIGSPCRSTTARSRAQTPCSATAKDAGSHKIIEDIAGGPGGKRRRPVRCRSFRRRKLRPRGRLRRQLWRRAHGRLWRRRWALHALTHRLPYGSHSGGHRPPDFV